MSYDIYLKIDTGGAELATVEDAGNYTSNCRAMFVEATGGPGPTSLDGKTCSEARDVLLHVICEMESHREKFEALNPTNGWGSYETFLVFLRQWLAACERHPKALVSVCS